MDLSSSSGVIRLRLVGLTNTRGCDWGQNHYVASGHCDLLQATASDLRVRRKNGTTWGQLPYKNGHGS